MKRQFNLLLATIFLVFSGLLAGLAGSHFVAQAASLHTQTLSIVKYALTPGASGFVENQTKNDGTLINNLPTDDQGKDLKALAGITYVIQEIEPHSDKIHLTAPSSDEYTTIGESHSITTGADGTASIILGDGVYLVSEQANSSAGLSTPAQPVVVQLPQWNTDDSKMLNPVYLYPKSSLENQGSGGEDSTAPLISNNRDTSSNTMLPKTGDSHAGGLSFAGSCLMIALGFVVFYKRKKV